MTLRRARHGVEVTGRGGTSFAAVIEFLNKHPTTTGRRSSPDGYAPVPPRPKHRRMRLLRPFNREETYLRQHEAAPSLGRTAY